MNEAIQFAQFIAQHNLPDYAMKDVKYLEDLYRNFKENYYVEGRRLQNKR